MDTKLTLKLNRKIVEDALQYFSAIQADCEILITGNGKGFKDALIPVMTAGEYLKSIRKYRWPVFAYYSCAINLLVTNSCPTCRCVCSAA